MVTANNKIMRKKFIAIILIVIFLCVFTSCTRTDNQTEIYSFSGENENIAINNGLIIVTNDSEKFIGGDLSFKGDEPLDAKDYFERFFYYKDGNEEIIFNNVTTTTSSNKGRVNISSELGSISSKNLFYYDDLELIKGSLNFLISGKLVNGENFEYDLTLIVKKVY
jgi:hypothetical protein